jgi:large subunit ribosomal protein L20
MPRVKRGVIHSKNRRNFLKRAKGRKWGNKSLMKKLIETDLKAGLHSFKDRRAKKRTSRTLWQIKINAAIRPLGLNYSKFIDLLHKKKIGVDRKVLSEMAVSYPQIFEALVNEVKK